MAYMTSRAVMDRLDTVVGPANWKVEHFSDDKRRLCRLSIRVDRSSGGLVGAEWVSKVDGADDTQIEGTKGGISDALKRAAVLWGIGRYLYRLDAPWADVVDGWANDAGWCNVSKDRKHIGKARVPRLPDWALPPKSKREDEPAKQQRQAKHHPSWAEDRSRYSAAVSEAISPIATVDQVADWCQSLGRPRPSGMTQESRVKLVNHLGTEQGRTALGAWLDAQGGG
jgi:hypothetical protein